MIFSALTLTGPLGQRITHSREQLTGTVQTLAQKMHLPGTRQARTKLPAPVAGRITQLGGTVRRRPMPAVGVVLGLVLVLRLLSRRTR